MNTQSACLLLSLCYAGSAAALGLGEIAVRSHLGQPLHATVPVLDAPADATSDCFSLQAPAGGMALPQRPHLSLERADGQALLHIRTSESIYDPVAQFVLVADCETRLQREYVLLLDPPATVTPPVLAAATSPVLAAATSPDTIATRATPSSPQQARRAVAAPVAATQRRAAPRARTTAQPAPRLVLSGRRLSGSAFALKLDTNLPDLNRTLPEGLTATELSDENTALTRKLAHLESQLTALHQRNAELEARRANATKSAAAKSPPPAASAKWPIYLLIAGLFIGAGALVVGLRRRSRQAADTLYDTWIASEPPASPPAREAAAAEAGEAPPSQPVPHDDMRTTPERMPEMAPPATLAESTEVKDDILDQAEVYMAHGHANLAIHLLQEHLRMAPTESPVPWLLLLDLLHREGDTAGYAAASAECRQHFNVNLSDHPVSQDNDSGEGLEAYPHLLEQLVRMWHSPERDAFFRDLIYDHRGGTRMGFRPAAYRDIILLRAIAQENPLADAA